jgi:hypothetical protein
MNGSASPFFGQVSSASQTVNIKTDKNQLAKIKTNKDFNQYLHRMEFIDKNSLMYGHVGDEAENKEEFSLKSNEVIVGIFGSAFDQFD